MEMSRDVATDSLTEDTLTPPSVHSTVEPLVLGNLTPTQGADSLTSSPPSVHSTVEPLFLDNLTTTQGADSLTSPPSVHSTVEPLFLDNLTTTQGADSLTSPPSVHSTVEPLVLGNLTTTQGADSLTSRPSVHSTVEPLVLDNLTTTQGADSLTSRPSVHSTVEPLVLDNLTTTQGADREPDLLASDAVEASTRADGRPVPLPADNRTPTGANTPWEIAVCYEGDESLHQHYTRCLKNPGHTHFIPADQFTMSHLPLGFQDDDILDYVKVVSDLTVQVKVNFISIDRPDLIPHSDKPYPCNNRRGKKGVTVGTGWIRAVINHPNKYSTGVTCTCTECLDSQVARSQFAVIAISTAAHVVFDAPEATSATCNLFYDKGNLPDPLNGVVTLGSFSCIVSDIDQDRCEMSFVTHDLNLASRIDELVNRRKDLQVKITKRSAPIWYQRELANDAAVVHPLAFIASHPHGCSKQISIGRCVRVDIFDNRHIQRLYNTATCPGSSGAQVVVLGRDPWEEKGKKYIHRGSHGDIGGLNYSGLVTEDFRLMGTLTLALQDWKRQGSWKAEFTYTGELDLHQQVQMCQRNPGHRKFTPIDLFTVDSLPPGYHDNNIVEYIRAVSNLTVRVTVQYVSEKRPPTIRGSTQPYPWFNSRGSYITRVGSGWVGSVMIYDNEEDMVCDCQECSRSPRPVTQFAYVYIQTAAHVVFDKREVEHTSVQIFLDKPGAAADDCEDVVTLTGLSDVYVEVQDDRCEMTYVTHDLGLAKKLHTMTEIRYKQLKVLDKYRLYNSEVEEDRFDLTSSAENTDQVDTVKIRNEHTLTVVVSHPHGCSKQVTIGYSGDLDSPSGDQDPEVHNVPICPGCSGAPVFMLGVDRFFAYQKTQ